MMAAIRARLWLPTVSMMLVSLISYIDRNTLAILAPTILRETGLSTEQYGWVISAFSVAYMAGNPVWGLVLDRFGVRVGMLASVSLWTIASAAHALAGGFWSFALARAVLGFGEGATFPGGLRTAVQTLPPSSRSRGIAVAYSGGSLGAIVTPLIVTPVALAYGWRAAFWCTGLVGCAWLALWAVLSRDLPPPIERERAKVRVRLGDARLWAFMASYSLGGLPLAFVIYGSSLYLSQERGLTQHTLGRLLWVPPLGWEAGYFFWGWISDRWGSYGYGRLLAIAALLSLPLATAPYVDSLGALMAAMFFAMFVAAGFVILSIAYATDVFSTSHAGVIAGAGAGSWSAVVAVLMPLFGHWFDRRDYGAAFTTAALVPALGFLLWFFLQRVSPDMSRSRVSE